MRVYRPTLLYRKIAEETSESLQKVKDNESTITLGNFIAHFSIDAGVWKCVIGQLVMLTKMTTVSPYCIGPVGITVHHEPLFPTQKNIQVHLMQRFFGSTVTH